jgi:phosphoglycolate phosphatase
MTSEKKATLPKAMLFDLDGTLLDTLEDLGNAMNRVLAEREFPTHRLEAYRYFIGEGETIFVTRALPEENRNDETLRSCLDAFRRDYTVNWNVKTRPYDGVTEMLDGLTTHGVKMAILSNKPDRFTKRCVRDLLPHWAFDAVLGQRPGVPRKPDPRAALEVAELLRTGPADFLYLGDSAVDMKTAIASGMFPVGALWGFRSAEELQKNGAQLLIRQPTEILDLFD